MTAPQEPAPEQNAGEPSEHTDTGDQPEPARTFSQAELDRVIEDRLKRERKKYTDYDALKTKAEQYDALMAESATDQERAVNDAKQQARSEVMAEVAAERVKAAITTATGGALTADDLAARLEFVNTAAFLADDGSVDTDKVSSFVATLAPPREPQRWPDFGQGKRDPVETKPSVAAGRDLYKQTHPSST